MRRRESPVSGPTARRLFKVTPRCSTAKRILSGLQERGLRPGDRVILQVDALEDHYPAFWACILGGIGPATVAVAPSYAERNGIVDKLFNAWELLGHPPILTSRHLVEPIAGLVARLLPMDGLTIVSVDELQGRPPAEDIYDSQPDDLVFLQLTWGSIGVPKCIKETHRSIFSHVHAVRQFDGHTKSGYPASGRKSWASRPSARTMTSSGWADL